MFNFSTLTMLFEKLPALVTAIETILNSGEVKTVEDAISALISHITPGQPNSPALDQTKPPT